MGKIVIPKHTSDLNEIHSALQIYYEENDWLDNGEFKNRLKVLIGDSQYESSYTKKAQVPSYYGFIEWQDPTKNNSPRRLTSSGKRYYQAVLDNNVGIQFDCLMEALEDLTFGRNNIGAPSSDSDIDAPCLFIRAAIDLNYLTLTEFAYLLWKMVNKGESYTDTLDQIKESRKQNNLKIEALASTYKDAKAITYLVKCGFLTDSNYKISISSVVLEKYRDRLLNLKIYNIDKDINLPSKKTELPPNVERVKGATNTILYGIPGSGKSYTIDNFFCRDKKNMERVVFHPDYSNTDFIGQLLPRLIKTGSSNDSILSYEFVPGPFTRILEKAHNNPNEMYFLVIEEINRGNAAAIFGDIFQLLDRDSDGNSKYFISNYEIAKYVYTNEMHDVTLPSNLTLLATMNTADQNVFTLDTAFQRRWQMLHIENEINKAHHANNFILDTKITWKEFNSTINKYITENNFEYGGSEDKRLGSYFVSADELVFNPETENTDVEIAFNAKMQNRRFPEKVLKYLWDDAFKFNREIVFNEKYKSLDELITAFESFKSDERFNIFNFSLKS